MRFRNLFFLSALFPLVAGAVPSGDPDQPPSAASTGPDTAGSVARLESAADALRLAARRDPRLRMLADGADAARAERSEGRALPNPEAGLGYLGDGSARRWHADATGDVTALAFYPWRRGAADARYASDLAELAAQRADRERDIGLAYYRAVAAAQIRGLVEQSAATWEAAAELSRRQRAEGTLNALDLSETEAAAAEARFAARRAGADAEAAREDLGRLLGVAGGALEFPDTLPEPSAPDAPLEALQASAAERNPELISARALDAAAERQGKVTAGSTVPRIKAGVGWERDEAGRDAFGPVVAAEIPLFDPGFARLRRSRAERRRTLRGVEAARAEAGSEIRGQSLRLAAARLNYEEGSGSLVPLRREALKEVVKRYNSMLDGVYRLLEARRAELSSRVLTVEALRDYWCASVELERLAPSSSFSSSPATPGESK